MDLNTLENLIKEKLYAEFPDAILKLEGDGHHYTLIISSAKFSGKKMLEQHRMVYGALGTLVGKEVHALSLKTQSLD